MSVTFLDGKQHSCRSLAPASHPFMGRRRSRLSLPPPLNYGKNPIPETRMVTIKSPPLPNPWTVRPHSGLLVPHLRLSSPLPLTMDLRSWNLQRSPRYLLKDRFSIVDCFFFPPEIFIYLFPTNCCVEIYPFRPFCQAPRPVLLLPFPI